MIYQYRKYRSIRDFFENKPKGKDENFTILHKCQGRNFKDFKFNSNCFGCLFCVDKDQGIEDFKNGYSKTIIEEVYRKAFRLEMVESPRTKSGLRHPYANLDAFTSVDETTNIQPWAAALLFNMSANPFRLSMEIPVFNDKYDRNGRLDIGILSDQFFLAVETKTSLDDALKDERFVEQHLKYTEEIRKYAKKYVYITLFGGNESDLYPIGNKYSTGVIGNKGSRFYNMICKNGIKFISANALWCLFCKQTENKDFCWDSFFNELFTDEGCLGLLSAGKVVLQDGEFKIIEI